MVNKKYSLWLPLIPFLAFEAVLIGTDRSIDFSFFRFLPIFIFIGSMIPVIFIVSLERTIFIGPDVLYSDWSEFLPSITRG